MATENKAITVIQLYEACLAEIRKGNANRHILLSGDDEGNWYHEMFFLFTPTKGEDIEYALPVSVEDFDKNSQNLKRLIFHFFYLQPPFFVS